MLKKKKLQEKIFVTGVIIPMFIINIFTSYIYKRNLQNVTSEISQMLSAQIESNIGTYLDHMSQVSLYPYYDQWIQKQVKSITLDGNRDYCSDIPVESFRSTF